MSTFTEACHKYTPIARSEKGMLTFHKAVEFLSIHSTALLVNDAMAICGSPQNEPSGHKWNRYAQAYLDLFREEP